MKVTITETTVVSYEVDIPATTSSLAAARLARIVFRQALDPTQFRHSVVQNSVEYEFLAGGSPQTFAEHELDLQVG
jgi:hypothetical protein